MTKTYVIRNQNQHYLSRDHQWVDGSEPRHLFRSLHHDTALNEMFERILHDPGLRSDVLEVEVDRHKHPQVEVLNPIAAPEPEADTEATFEDAADVIEEATSGA